MRLNTIRNFNVIYLLVKISKAIKRCKIELMHLDDLFQISEGFVVIIL